MKRNRVRNLARVATIFALIALATVSTVAWAGRPVYVGEPTSRTIAISSIRHDDWNTLLQKYVDKDGLVDYAGWKANAADRAKLQQYLSHLSTASLKTNSTSNEQLAFWINAYNAVTVEGILREYPTSSIRNHTAKVVGYNIWKDLKLHVDDQSISLDAIEHQVLRKMSEPRIHFAIVCASIGCPRLLNEAYTPARLDEQLDINAKDFFSRQQNFRFDAGQNQFQLSAILNWFGQDFGASRGDQLRRIAAWLPSEAAKNAAASGNVSVAFLAYNWDLNQQN
ncbi:MAG: DUF547 domain-containing protein [Planctomycetota bacterium]